jgi:hypothetical protein
MKMAIFLLTIFFLLPAIRLYPEAFRTNVHGSIDVTLARSTGNEGTVTIGVDGSVLINLNADVRFLRGIELEIAAPQAWMQYRGALAMMMYNNLNPRTAVNITDFTSRRIAFEPLPSRLRIIYHIPIRQNHGLRTTTSITVPTTVVHPDTFPILFRLTPIDKGLPAAFERLTFNVTARPILSDEGAVRIIPRFPPQQRNRPFTVLINDNVISNISEEIVLREGEHHLVILSDDYRNESRRFIVERGNIIDLIIELQDPTPMIIFEAPQNALIFLNGSPVTDIRDPILVDPGTHEVRYQIGNYVIIRNLTIQRGKTYRVALEIDLKIQEED